MQTPLVTVICLCYNQHRFVEEAIHSILNQSYRNIQVIIVDDASTDTSAQTIRDIVIKNPEIIFIPLQENLGNCKAFNRGLAEAQGEYIIDFAADDILLPNRIAIGVEHFENTSEKYGVQFSDAAFVDEQGRLLSLHSDRFTHAVPQGNIYKDLISRYFINGPTMMVRRKVLETLGGYDETLAYEDFDFWIRSSRLFHFFYIPEVLVKTRIVNSSMSQQQFKRSSAQRQSTWEVCRKILTLNRNQEEKESLAKRILYEIRVCLKLFDVELAIRYLQLWIKNAGIQYKD